MTGKPFYGHVVDVIEGIWGTYQAFGVISSGNDKLLRSASFVAEPTSPGSDQYIQVSLKSIQVWSGMKHGGKDHPMLAF